MIDAGEIRAALSRVRWVSSVLVLDQVDSTNDEALRLAAGGAPEGTVVVVDRQTSGRGRLGRAWWSEPGGSLVASWVVRPALGVDRWPLLSLAAGLAAAGAIERLTGVAVGLKWPNDLLAVGRKAGGILAEARLPTHLVAGLGVNLSCGIPPELEGIAVSVAGAGGRVPPRGELLAATLDGFAAEIADVEGLPARYRRRCATLGRRVRVTMPGGEAVEGIARDVDASGSLVVERDGDRIALLSGDVEHVRDAPGLQGP